MAAGSWTRTIRAESRGSESEEESKGWAKRLEEVRTKIQTKDRIREGNDAPSGYNLIKGFKKTTFDIN